MMPRRFSKGEAIRFGWEVTKRHFWFFFVTLLILGAVSVVGNIFEWIEPDNLAQAGLAIGIHFIQAILGLFLTLGVIRICLRFTANEEATLADLFGATLRQVGSYFLATILASIVITIGFILLVIPGIILSIRLSMAPFLIVDQNLGPIAALSRSWALTEGSGWNLFLFGILLVLLNILGVVAVFVGLFLSIPTSYVAFTFVYRKLQATLSPVPQPTTA